MSVGDARGGSGVIHNHLLATKLSGVVTAGRERESTLMLTIPRHGFLPNKRLGK